MRAPIRGFAVGVLALWAVCAVAGDAAARALVIERFDADVQVRPDGSILVTETIQARFAGSWNGIYRTIPVNYRSQWGFNYRLVLKGIDVTDERGNTLKHETSRERHYQKIKIWIPGAHDAVRTVVLRYRVDNALRFFEDHDELYWNITGDEWEVPIEAASARIVLPKGATGLRTLAFTGSYGSTEQDADVQTEGGQVSVTMRRSLTFREGLTIVVGWDTGLIARPTTGDRILDFVRTNWPVAIPLAVFPFMYAHWRRRGRDPRLRPIAVQYEPPDGLSPGEVGTLADSRPDMRDITATLVDLAVRGYIAIEEKEESGFLGLGSSMDFSFQLLKPPAEWDKLSRHELSLISAIFDSGTLTFVPLDALKNRFYTHLPSIRDRLLDRLVEHKYYRVRPDRVIALYVMMGVLAGGLLLGIGLAIGDSLGIAPAAAIVAGLATGAIIAGFGLVMPARTQIGTAALEGVLGFEEFLRRVEGPKLRRSDLKPDLFEKYLPYAMALGVEANWSKGFEGIASMSPSWYRGAAGMRGGIFYPALFAANLNNMSRHAGTVMNSAPRARSGRSGFLRGGGFSGGGFGGGGGGGF